jgi:uncharacterized circularly permuted ATP-grasp superfamily protein/uncharacterized alpha-E superfamily protein
MSSVPPSVRIEKGSLFSTHVPSTGLYDESVTVDRQIRPHWRQVAGLLDRLGAEELAVRMENASRIIREDGITYNIYGDPQGMDRPWELDVIPLLISPSEWRHIEKGLTQRATLLNRILRDLYGPQDLLRTGALPPALVFANPGFLRPCHGLRVPGDIYLHLHAADLARAPNGEWWVVADRTQSPSGSGYALENRIVMARVLPEEYREAQVHRLAPFFATQRETLRQLAPDPEGNPHIVLLTPGPHNETYFEHAYLARYLGLTLVEGGDLTIRNSIVYLKTLEGLQRVDVILRRVDDNFCDPLELRGDSFLGVPGLVQAARAGHVTIANALGSSLVESPAFLAFLPSLCRLLLGEDLLLPSVATWWSGQAKEQKHILEHLDQIVVKPAFGSVSQLPFFGLHSTSGAREKIANDIGRRSFAFVGQEQVAFSTAPAWIDEAFEPRGVVVRCYAAASGDSYAIMPGGLTRFSPKAGEPLVTMQSGGGSKDTWVLSDQPVAPVTLLTPSGQPANALRISAEAPSRVADNLFWLGRYTERLESTLRLLRCALSRMSDEGSALAAAELNALVELFASTERIPKRLGGRVPAREVEQQVLELVYHPQRVGSVREIVLRLRQIASMVRDRLSADTWRILNQLQLDSKTRAGRLPLANAQTVCNKLIMDLAAFSGMEMENMTRGHGWRFLDFGRRLERACNLVDTIRAAMLIESRESVAGPLLEYADSAITYRRRYYSEPRLATALELLLTDPGNPRSLAFQLNVLRDHAQELPATLAGVDVDAMVERATTLARSPSGFSFASLEQSDAENVKSLLSEISVELGALSDQLTKLYFCHTVSHRVEGRS